MKLLYFAWVRQKVGLGEEDWPLPAGVVTIFDLVAALRERGGGYAAAFGEPKRLRAARNREHAGFDTRIDDADEIAFFPPVTGG